MQKRKRGKIGLQDRDTGSAGDRERGVPLRTGFDGPKDQENSYV